MRKFAITKFFRGGSTTYYAKMSATKRMKRDTWRSQLEEWGENTSGGENYGYRIDVKQIKQIPRGTDFYRRLSFNKHYITKK